MKHLLLFLLLPTCLMAQEKIGNKIYKYGELYHSIQGNTLISFNEADARLMNKTLGYFSKAGAKDITSWNSIFLPGTEVSEDSFVNILAENKIQTLISIDILDSSSATMNRTTASAYSTVNRKQGKSTLAAGGTSTTKTLDYTTEMSLRLSIFSEKDGFSKPVGIVEGKVINDSPDTTAESLAKRIVRRMTKALEEQRAF